MGITIKYLKWELFSLFLAIKVLKMRKKQLIKCCLCLGSNIGRFEISGAAGEEETTAGECAAHHGATESSTSLQLRSGRSQ